MEYGFQPDEVIIEVYDPDGTRSRLVNKMYNGISVTHVPSGTVIRVHHFRSQYKNRQVALEMLLHVVTDPRY